MSLLKMLFGVRSKAQPEEATPVSQENYRDFTIIAKPYKDGGQYRLAGAIQKNIAGTLKTHDYVRADQFSSLEDATLFSLRKGRQIIDERGEGLFHAQG